MGRLWSAHGRLTQTQQPQRLPVQYPPSLRPRQRLLPPLAGRGHGVHVRLLPATLKQAQRPRWTTCAASWSFGPDRRLSRQGAAGARPRFIWRASTACACGRSTSHTSRFATPGSVRRRSGSTTGAVERGADDPRAHVSAAVSAPRPADLLTPGQHVVVVPGTRCGKSRPRWLTGPSVKSSPDHAAAAAPEEPDRSQRQIAHRGRWGGHTAQAHTGKYMNMTLTSPKNTQK